VDRYPFAETVVVADFRAGDATFVFEILSLQADAAKGKISFWLPSLVWPSMTTCE
jgi:hypothetical protein